MWLVAVGTNAQAQGVSGYTEVTGAAVTVPGFTSATGSATCPSGDVVLSGGYTLAGGNMVIDDLGAAGRERGDQQHHLDRDRIRQR